jgi:transcriptional regulator with XRE-family HTH domain
MPDEKETFSRVRPTWDDLLPSAADRAAFDDASAALEAGRFVRKLRTAAGLTQTQLAARLDVSQARVSAIETGEGRDGPSYALLKRIVAACGQEWSLAGALVRQAAPPERAPVRQAVITAPAGSHMAVSADEDEAVPGPVAPMIARS